MKNTYQKLIGILILIYMLLAVTGCGSNVENDIEEDSMISATIPIEATTVESEPIENVETENKQNYENLISKYDTEPIEYDCLPCVGSSYAFQISDKVLSVESLGVNYNAEYLLVHYENAKNDLIIRDYSDKNPEYNYEIDMKIMEKFTEINQINPYYAAIRPSDKLSEIPEIGAIYNAEKIQQL